MGKTFEVKVEQKIKRCKMKVGDKVKVVGYGSDAMSYYVEFENMRLPKWKFWMGSWLFKKMIRG